LRNKNILVISPQSWGKMMLAKHHYALELAKAGNQVYFLNPPDPFRWNIKSAADRIQIQTLPIHPSLHIINQVLFFPYNLKFHARSVYNTLIKIQIRDILKQIGNPVDILWSFDLGNLFPLILFPSAIFKVFHPVDEPGDHQAILAAKGADIIFSVTREIIEKYKLYKIPSYFINHGLAEEFVKGDSVPYTMGSPLHAGMSGNLMRPDLDRNILIQIVEENPEIIFDFYGSYIASDSNIGAGLDKGTDNFIKKLGLFSNVKFHGVLNTADLSRELNRMDILLICYDIEKDQSKGTNYHKVMEYLSTGKAVVSNNITTYKDQPDLVIMPAERNTNNRLPELFRDTVTRIKSLNSKELADQRIAYARNNLYSEQLIKMELLICNSVIK
jgi:glycosyltransferase involved in cell wall biosynthesis